MTEATQDTKAVPAADEAVWERWSKKRTFVRAVEGTYGELVHELFSQPRVYSSKDWKWKDGPQNFGKKIINLQAVKVAQLIEAHLDVYAPGGYGQKHGHMSICALPQMAPSVKKSCHARIPKA